MTVSFTLNLKYLYYNSSKDIFFDLKQLFRKKRIIFRSLFFKLVIMRTFIFLLFFSILISLSTLSKANSITYLLEFSSEKSSSKVILTKKKNFSSHSTLYSDKDIKPKSIEPITQKTAKEKRKIEIQVRKEFRKAIWKYIIEQRKVNKKVRKENRKKGIKNQRIHWAAYLAIFGALIALGIFIAAIAIGSIYVSFSYLLPLALLLLPVSIISGIIGVSVVANDDNEKYDKTTTMVLSLVGGILSLVTLLFIILLLLALSASF
jgi:hypothetical protein